MSNGTGLTPLTDFELRNSAPHNYGRMWSCVLMTAIMWVIVIASYSGHSPADCMKLPSLILAVAMSVMSLVIGIGCVGKVNDQAVKVRVDRQGIHDLRFSDGVIPWTDIETMNMDIVTTEGVLQRATLTVMRKSTDGVRLEFYGLDMKPDEIYDRVKRMWVVYSGM